MLSALNNGSQLMEYAQFADKKLKFNDILKFIIFSFSILF